MPDCEGTVAKIYTLLAVVLVLQLRRYGWSSYRSTTVPSFCAAPIAQLDNRSLYHHSCKTNDNLPDNLTSDYLSLTFSLILWI